MTRFLFPVVAAVLMAATGVAAQNVPMPPPRPMPTSTTALGAMPAATGRALSDKLIAEINEGIATRAALFEANEEVNKLSHMLSDAQNEIAALKSAAAAASPN
jgi:hypothetical protein